MDHPQIQNSEASPQKAEWTKQPPVLGFLNRRLLKKLQQQPQTPPKHPHSAQDDHTTDDSSSCADAHAHPTLSFRITGHAVRDSVLYNVQMKEERVIHHRRVVCTYRFNTRYSMLLALHEKLLEANPLLVSQISFPKKHFFGNTSESVIKGRKKELAEYLNRVACSTMCPVFEEFVNQVKKANFSQEIKI